MYEQVHTYIRIASRITDRRWKRALADNPASKEPMASKLKRGAAVRVHPLVIRFIHSPLQQLLNREIHETRENKN
jgi:hypothetical protein